MSLNDSTLFYRDPEYKAIRDAHVEQWMKLYRALSGAGLDGHAELDTLERMGRERTAALGSLNRDDFATIEAEWCATADAILAKSRPAQSSTPLAPQKKG